MGEGIKDRAAIVGIGQTAFGKGFVQGEEMLGCEAIKLALDDAGLAPSEVDGLVSLDMQATYEEEISGTLGLGDLTFLARLPAGGGGAAGTVGLAAMAVATGQANVVVAWRSRKRSAVASRVWMQTPSRVSGRKEMWKRPWGVVRPVDELALMYRRYMHRYGATREHLANIALAFRAHANANPAAVMHGKELTLQDYLDARMISDPLCLFDCCLETDAAIAVVVVSAERARDLRQPPAIIHAFAQGLTAGSSMLGNFFVDDPLHTQAHACSAALWRHSDIKQSDIAVAQIYDAFTPEVLFCLEAYGFCGPGEAAAFCSAGNIRHGGGLPVNTGGGGLSECYIHGFNMITEGVKQIRGVSTSQVPDAEACFVCASDLTPTGAFVLRR